MKKFGSHVSYNKKNKYLLGAAEEALSYNADAFMIFVGPPHSTVRGKKEDMYVEEYIKEYESRIPRDNILVHGPYIVNPSSPEKYGFAIEFLTKELKMMEYLGLSNIVIHPGAFTKFTKEEALKTLVKSLKAILQNTSPKISIHLETMAGKGTEIGTTLDDLRWIYEKVGSKRIGITVDTCHMWDAGYNIKELDKWIAELKRTKTLSLVRSMHINDSKNEMSAHKDRHANIGHGFIGKEALKNIIHHKSFKNIIKVLETPYIDDKAPYKDEIKMLK